jgi:hypothetical protein
MLPPASELIARYKRACDFKQPINQQRIIAALNAWQRKVTSKPLPIRFAESSDEIKQAAVSARAVWAARSAWDPNDAWDALAARDARTAAVAGNAGLSQIARSALITWAAREDLAAWTARIAMALKTAWTTWENWNAWDCSWNAITAIGAAAKNDQKTFNQWIYLLDALEAGAWLFWITDKSLLVCTIPDNIHVDEGHRLHSNTGPAFSILDIKDYYWHGVNVPEQVIEYPETITAAQIDSEENTEVRRVLLERYNEGRAGLATRDEIECLEGQLAKPVMR